MSTSHAAPPTPTEQLIAAMQEQTSWLRALAMPQVRKAIEQTLTKTAMRKAYEASDGERTLREVAAAADASTRLDLRMVGALACRRHWPGGRWRPRKAPHHA
jgi:hypothetical protein